MIRKLSNAITQDLLLTFRSGHIYVILALAAIMLLLVFFLPPKWIHRPRNTSLMPANPRFLRNI